MQILKIDTEFHNLIPPLSEDEFKQLKENIIADGCREPLVVWNGTIVDGHNRYKICTENNIPFKTESKDFADRAAVIEWMLRNQLGRRNLNDFQRNEVALKYEKIIAEKMRERQRMAGGDKKSEKAKIANDQTNHSDFDKTSKRKEMAKIAGTSEGSIQRSKLIIEKGTQEQIDRARKGGKGNSVTAIAKEITEQSKPKLETKVCKQCKQELTLENFYLTPGGKPKSTCKVCENSKYRPRDIIRSRYNNKVELPPEIANMTEEEIIGDLYNVDKVIVHTVDDLIRDFTVNFDTFLETLRGIIEIDKELLKDAENNKKMAAVLSEAVAAMQSLKGDYIDEQ